MFPTGAPAIYTDPDTAAPEAVSTAWTVITRQKDGTMWSGSIVRVSCPTFRTRPRDWTSAGPILSGGGARVPSDRDGYRTP